MEKLGVEMSHKNGKHSHASSPEEVENVPALQRVQLTELGAPA